MQQLDSLIKNGCHVVINGGKTRVIFKLFIVADYMVLYSFFGFKGAVSSYNCIQCERWAGGAKNRINVLSYEITDKFQLRDVNTVDPNRGYKIASLNKMISYQNICLPL